MVERNNGFFETSFLPGRTFASPADFNDQLTEWLTRANTRTVRAIDGRPVDLLETDRQAMTPPPPVDPQIGLTHRIRLARDYYVRVDANDYSVGPSQLRPRGITQEEALKRYPEDRKQNPRPDNHAPTTPIGPGPLPRGPSARPVRAPRRRDRDRTGQPSDAGHGE